MDDKTEKWLRELLDDAVEALTDGGPFQDPVVEVKPAWALPGQLLLGKARRPSDPEFRWFICGDFRFDHVSGDVAEKPRDVLRHFSMKWQLEAETLDANAKAARIELAEDLYALAEDERFWNPNQ